MKYKNLLLFLVLLQSNLFGVTIGIINYQTVLKAETEETKEIILEKEEEIRKSINQYNKTLKTTQKCLVEQIRGALANKMLLKYSLIERKAILKQLDTKKRFYETESSKKQKERK